MEGKLINKIENNELSKELIQKIQTFYNFVFKDDLEEGLMDENSIKQKVEGEINFYKRVLDTVVKAQKENLGKKVVTLFDIDETLVQAKRNKDGQYDHIIRPSAESLLEKIGKMNVKNGILTTRGLEALKTQLENELKTLKPFLDQNFIFSVRGNYVPMDEELAIKNNNQSFASGDIEKVYFLNELNKKTDLSECCFIPVDDLQYPAIYKYGVDLKGKEKFFI